MNRTVFAKIMDDEGVNYKEAKEIWLEEMEACDGDIEQALYNLGMEPDFPFN